MKASELRIGNFVTTIDDKIICTSVKGFYGFAVNTGIITHNNSVNDFEYLKPISLTEEWLLKFGFQKNGCYYISEETNIEFYLTNGKLYCELYGETIFNIENVHQLQNLYFSLSGEELTIIK